MPDLTQQQKDMFVSHMQSEITSYAIHSQHLIDAASQFEALGGAPTFGNDAALMVNFINALRDSFLDTDRRALIAQMRTDFTGE